MYAIRIEGSTCHGTWTPLEESTFDSLDCVGNIIADYRRRYPKAIHVRIDIAAPDPRLAN